MSQKKVRLKPSQESYLRGRRNALKEREHQLMIEDQDRERARSERVFIEQYIAVHVGVIL